MSVLITREKASTERKRIRFLLESGKELTNRHIQMDIWFISSNKKPPQEN